MEIFPPQFLRFQTNIRAGHACLYYTAVSYGAGGDHSYCSAKGEYANISYCKKISTQQPDFWFSFFHFVSPYKLANM